MHDCFYAGFSQHILFKFYDNISWSLTSKRCRTVVGRKYHIWSILHSSPGNLFICNK